MPLDDTAYTIFFPIGQLMPLRSAVSTLATPVRSSVKAIDSLASLGRVCGIIISVSSPSAIVAPEST